MTAEELLVEAMRDIRSMSDPVARERAARELGDLAGGWQESLRLVRSDAVREMRHDGMSLRTIGVMLGVSTSVLQRLGSAPAPRTDVDDLEVV